jgi:cytochrome P450
MTVANDVRFASTLVRPFSRAMKVSVSAGVRRRWRPYRKWTGAVISDYDPLDPATAAHPEDAYRRLHAGGRVHYNPRRSNWILSRLGDVRDGLRADEALSSADGVSRQRLAVPILVTTDGKQHSEMRKRVLPAFTRAALENWRPLIDELAAKLVDDVLNDPGCDVVERLAVPMPMLLIAHLMGVPEGDVDDFRRWSTDVVKVADMAITPRGALSLASSMGGLLSIYRYFQDQFAVGGLKGSDTLLGSLLDQNESGSMDDIELFYFAMLLLIAGNETTTNLLGGMFDSFAANPDQFDIVREDPELIPMAIEEQLRFSSPIQCLYRTVRTPYVVGDVTIPPGERVLLSYAAANRDPLAFADPDQFRVRRNPKDHVAFGFGPHLCLGAQLTRMEAHAILRELVKRTSRIEAIGETAWTTNSTLRGPARLQVRLTPA